MKPIIYFLLLFNTHLLNAQQKNDFNWLIGSWKINIKPNENIVEKWLKNNDSLYTSKSFYIKNNDTILQETVKLIFQNNQWIYIVTSANQNDNKPVEFKLIYIGKNEFICTNPNHDYPNRIAYRLINKKQLYASIEGEIKAKYRKGNYDFVKL